MGLDMYLMAEKYISGWDAKDNAEYKTIQRMFGFDGDEPFCESAHTARASINVAYWRKANAIHNWFVNNVQDGNDDCGYHYVEPSKLKELVEICKKLIKSRDVDEAKDLLETRDGCFFGGIDYDEWYWKDLENTVTKLEKVLKHPNFKGCDFYYHSSW